MAWKTKPTRFNLKLVRAVRKALAKGEDCGMQTETHRLRVMTPEAERRATYTICLIQDDEGTCMVTCREVPGVLIFETSKVSALAAAHTAIQETLAA